MYQFLLIPRWDLIVKVIVLNKETFKYPFLYHVVSSCSMTDCSSENSISDSPLLPRYIFGNYELVIIAFIIIICETAQ